MNEEFKEINLLLNDMPQHICYVAHQKARKTGEGENDKFGVDGSGSAKDYLIGELDYVGYMEMLGRKRSVSFSPSEKFYAKNTCNLPQAHKVPTTIDANGNVVGTFNIKDVEKLFFYITGSVDKIQKNKVMLSFYVHINLILAKYILSIYFLVSLLHILRMDQM
mgnify:CR=1 FL=1